MKTILTLILIAVTLFCGFLPGSALAASSSLIRSYDDVKVEGKDFSGQQLQEAEFANTDLKAANFSDAQLQGAVFNACSLVNATLENANMTNGIAYLSDFQGANLKNAIFTEALLLRSHFENADITGADFSFAILDKDQQKQLCDQAEGVNPVTGISTKESLNCL